MNAHTRHGPRRARRASTVLALAALTLAFLLVPTSAHAATITVASGLVPIGDDGQCSLREAIANAEADSQVHADCPAGTGADVITLPGGTYLLSSGRAGASESAFVIGTDLTIVGAGSVVRAGAEPTVLDAGAAFRHFEVHSSGALTLQGVRLQHGFTDDRGGAIRNFGGLTVTSSTLTSNQAPAGSAISNGGTALITDSLVTANAGGEGAGVPSAISNGGVLHVIASTVHGNSVTGIDNVGGSVTISGTTISANTGSRAGGIRNYAWQFCSWGTSCAVEAADLTIRNSTITSNTALDPSAAGGVDSTEFTSDTSDPRIPADLTLQNVTIVGNSSPGGAQVRASGADVRNSIIAQPTSGTNCDQTDDADSPALGPWTGGANLTDGSCSSAGFTQVADVLLQPLAHNGGPTLTHLPHPASPLIDAGDQTTCDQGVRTGGSATDQRGSGFPRTVGGACDIGAVEADADALLGALALDVSELAFRGDRGRGHEGLRTSLLATLGAASDAVERGDHDAAAGQLQAFGNQVEAHAGGPIMEHDAQRLTTGALTIIELLPEGGTEPDDDRWPPRDGEDAT